MQDQTNFPPSRFSALRRAAQARPRDYARTRNHLNGAVTALSPYVTHGLLTAGELFDIWHRRRGLTLGDKLLGELAWREFYHHVWLHRGDDILENLGPGLPGVRYSADLPEDVRRAATGVPLIDASVRQLYSTGYLHNHQRMWLASYVVHMRKTHWRAGADWMYGHLLDGDLASNHLSWQWVAGTFSHKPYLFNADNVARFAPDLVSPGTAIDRDYSALVALAHTGGDVGPERQRPDPYAEPPLIGVPPLQTQMQEPQLRTRQWAALVHPWSLDGRSHGQQWLGVLHAGFHRNHPWSARRWMFVLTRMTQLCKAIHFGDLNDLAHVLRYCPSPGAVQTFNPGYRQALMLAVGKNLSPPSTALPPLDRCYRSYSSWLKAQCKLRPDLNPAA
jgi:deoxyribodipyrimidine photo-lyase